MVLHAKVLDPLASIQGLASGPMSPAVRAARSEEVSPLVALELAEFLVENLEGWQSIIAGGQDPLPTSAQWQLFSWLKAALADPGGSRTWLSALRDAWSASLVICGERTGTPPQLNLIGATGWNPPGDQKLLAQIAMALPSPAPTPPNTPSAPDPAAQPLPKLDPRTHARYVIRCVYQRPQCGPLHEDVVSDPSDDFAIAAHFDFDAPQRRIAISLPIDTSPAGLRKFPKNVAFMLSDQLKQQMGRLKDLKSMTDGDFDNPGLDIGMVCSFSIPIITICALFVLIIFVMLLNIVFWWLPLLRICLPLGLSKGSS
jgi:hypothetical protein